MLGTMLYVFSEFQHAGMTRSFNDERGCHNLYHVKREGIKKYFPHGVTENEFLERLVSDN